LCPRRMRYLFLYSSIANFQSPCPNLLISVDKRPGGLQPISWWQKTKKKSFSHKLILHQSPSILRTKQFYTSTSPCCRETNIAKVYLHTTLEACSIITSKSISVKEIDLPVADTNEPRH
jgi:hypothetical protein